MSNKRLKVLLIMEQCNPGWPSVPLIGYNFFKELSKKADVTLCTHGRNRTNLEKAINQDNIIYFDESSFSSYYYKVTSRIFNPEGYVWPLAHAFLYPIYAEFNRSVYKKFRIEVLEGKFDIVHAMTPIIPRYPVKMIQACRNTPFILGPVNGGLPFPKGFENIEKKEWGSFNFLRFFCKFIPGYYDTYKNADRVIVGSRYTYDMIQKMFQLPEERMILFSENGLPQSFFAQPIRSDHDPIELLFIGRLVPYKGADILIDSINNLPAKIKQKVALTIVGDGEERNNLENLVDKYGLRSQITFSGWISHEKTAEYYRKADIFCYPSIREFGGGVVLEAMAAGLPCIVVDYGGIGEYVTQEEGFKIKPESREVIVNELTKHIEELVNNPSLRKKMGQKAYERALEYEWSHKADKIIEIYRSVTSEETCSILT